MLYSWLVEFSDTFSLLNVFRYITFRTFLSFFTSFLLCWFISPFLIRRFSRKQIKQNIRDLGPKTHQKKKGTPTMGGGAILLVLFVSALFWMDLSNYLVWGSLIIFFSFGGVGYWDDYLKLKGKTHRGLSVVFRLCCEFAITITVFTWLRHSGAWDTTLYVPFFKNIVLDLGWFHILFASFVVVGSANAVNLTDGLDGLAIVPVVICSGTLLIFAYISGHFTLTEYLDLPFVSGAGELAPLAAAISAAGLAFLWFNSHPAQVFMGDVGSLSLGGFLGVISVLTKNEILLVLLGGVFVVEAISVISQVVSFQLTGKRVFKMAPLHHHFELKGMNESKIIVRFWIVSILLAILSLSTLKLR